MPLVSPLISLLSFSVLDGASSIVRSALVASGVTLVLSVVLGVLAIQVIRSIEGRRIERVRRLEVAERLQTPALT
jgi:hypothetical protein